MQPACPRESSLRVLSHLMLLIFAHAVIAQDTPGLRETVLAYTKEATTHAQFESDMRRGNWKIGAKQIESSQNPDKTWAVSIRYRVHGGKGEACNLEFRGPLEPKSDLSNVPLLQAGC